MDKPDVRADSYGKDLFEVSVFLLLIVPSMIIDFFVLGSENISFAVTALSVIFRDIALTSLIVFFLWRNGEPLTLIGWNFNHLKKEVALGAGLFVPVMIGIRLLEKAFQHLGLSSNITRLPEFLSAKGPVEILLACILVTVVTVAEETIFRGYLILRFNALTTSVAASVIITSGVFALGHGYEGPASIGTIGVLGVVLALIYIWRKSLIAPMVIHFLIDFFPLVLMPLLKIR
jgi:membrane protease YdiL (CAAX protease family)